MDSFFDFLKQNWSVILTISFLIIETVFIFIKRKPKSVDDFVSSLNEVLALVPEYVSRIECPGYGEKKKATVIKFCLDRLEKSLGRGLSDKEIETVSTRVGEKIETVLSTPKKKENVNE